MVRTLAEGSLTEIYPFSQLYESGWEFVDLALGGSLFVHIRC